MYFDFSSQALAVDTAALLLSWGNTYATMDTVDWILGRDSPSRKGKDGDYWNDVKRRLSETIAAARWLYTQLLSTGESVMDPEFLEAVPDALAENSMKGRSGRLRASM